MQRKSLQNVKSVVIQGFSGGCSEKVCPAPQKCITRTSLYTVLDINFFRIPVNHQGNGCDKWVQTRGY